MHPKLPWIEPNQPLPPPESAWTQDSRAPGLIAASEDLNTARLKEAYSQGIFPWFNDNQPVLWWSTDPRMVLAPAKFNIHRSFKKKLRAFIAQPGCEIRVDHQFAEVIHHCAHRVNLNQPNSNSNLEHASSANTWIVKKMREVYQQAHQEGFVHSIETWVSGKLVGGLYCVALGRAVFGESMFSLEKDASKIALAALVAFSLANGIELIDCQQNTKHLASMGGFEISRNAFLRSISISQHQPSPSWVFKTEYWDLLLTQSKKPTSD